jgi:ABC-2 type transport system ATP-binding protein
MTKQIKDQSVIEISHLSKRYDEVIAVDEVNLKVNSGSIFALLGPNGAGKTTTVKILEGLMKRDAGEIRIFGLDPWEDQEKLKLMIGVMPQEFNFFEKLTPLEAVDFYIKLFNLNIDPYHLLKMVLLEDSINTLFEKLSGGQKQKLGLALSIINNPDLLFLDEPTTGLDPASRRAIWSVIRAFKDKGKTIVLTTHYLEEAEQLADIVAIINHGKIIAIGSPSAIVSQHGTGRKLVLKADKEMFRYLESMGIKVSENNGALEILLNPYQMLSNLISIIEISGIEYSQLTVRSDSLEDVFIKLVGERKEDEKQWL